jgi:hypothetical protein
LILRGCIDTSRRAYDRIIFRETTCKASFGTLSPQAFCVLLAL